MTASNSSHRTLKCQNLMYLNCFLASCATHSSLGRGSRSITTVALMSFLTATSSSPSWGIMRHSQIQSDWICYLFNMFSVDPGVSSGVVCPWGFTPSSFCISELLTLLIRLSPETLLGKLMLPSSIHDLHPSPTSTTLLQTPRQYTCQSQICLLSLMDDTTRTNLNALKLQSLPW